MTTKVHERKVNNAKDNFIGGKHHDNQIFQECADGRRVSRGELTAA